MTPYIALLRGINVSGQNPIAMGRLKESFSGLGFADVTTYLQSGNIVFNSAASNESKLAISIHDRIFQAFGFDVPVLVMSAGKIGEIANSNPLWLQTGGDEKLFHCTFLFQPVSPASFQSFDIPAVAGEQAVLKNNAVLLYCPHGYGKTKLNNNYFERKLGVKASTRNWRTVLALQALCAAH